MSNIYLEEIEKHVERVGIEYIGPFTEVFALLALTKELQTLNETLKFALSDADGCEAPLAHLIWAALTEWEPPLGP